jgi:hypothetical protein
LLIPEAGHEKLGKPRAHLWGTVASFEKRASTIRAKRSYEEQQRREAKAERLRTNPRFRAMEIKLDRRKGETIVNSAHKARVMYEGTKAEMLKRFPLSDRYDLFRPNIAGSEYTRWFVCETATGWVATPDPRTLELPKPRPPKRPWDETAALYLLKEATRRGFNGEQVARLRWYHGETKVAFGIFGPVTAEITVYESPGYLEAKFYDVEAKMLRMAFAKDEATKPESVTV